MKIKKKGLAMIAAAVVIVVAVVLMSRYAAAVKTARAGTDRHDYAIGDFVRVAINNKTDQAICFSGCYPYLLEKQNGRGWEEYQYDACDDGNLVAICANAGEVKKFQLSLSEAQRGLHRLKIPVCPGCAPGQKFEAGSTLYSNTFEVK